MQNEIEFFDIFPWNKNFETGISIIDEQHQKLVHILNQLAAHLANRSNPITLNKIFNELMDYTQYHFKTEEEVWYKYFKNDDWYELHEHTHKSFLDKVIALKNEQNRKPLDDVIQDIVSFLSKWLATHILDTDKRMALTALAIESGQSMTQAKIHAQDEMGGSTEMLVSTVLTMYDSLSTRTLELMREKTLRKQAEKALSLSEERWKFILEGGAEGVWDWDMESDKVFSSEGDVSLFDIVDIKKQGGTQASRIHPEDIRRVEADLQAHLDGETDFFVSKHRILETNNSWISVLSRGKVVSRDESGKALRMVGTHSDITERELAALIYQHSNQAVFITNTDNEIISVNPAFTKITGYSAEDIKGRNPKFLSSGRQGIDFYQQMWNSINSKERWVGEIWNKRKNGEIYPQILDISVIKSPDGAINHHFALFSDITEKKEADALIVEQANFDPLTKLPNRSLFHEYLAIEFKSSKHTKLPFALLFIDLDNFKDVNDTLGHDSGDMLLIQAAQRILGCVRHLDTVARLGGDEFTVILPALKNRCDVELITQKIIDSLKQPFSIAENVAYISASVGITLYPDDSENIISMLKYADQAMYKAKNEGRNCFCYFTKSMQDKALVRQNLIKDLREAIKFNQFEVYYQPISDCITGEIFKAEALLRWKHPLRGWVSPADFIPVAEETGLIIEIGDWVFQEVIQQTKLWAQAYNNNIQVSINKSPLQFQDKDNYKIWIDKLNNIGLMGKNITIEMTESLLIKDDPVVSTQLLKFRDAGIQVSLDDFGTGYSSLSYLKKFDIDYLKIDQSFIRNLTPESVDMALSEAIIVMAHKLGLKVIAEGVETEQQFQLLKEADCDYIQGYLISQAIPAVKFEEILKSQKLERPQITIGLN